MARYDQATWNPITANFNKGRRLSPTKGLILHITDGAPNKKTGKKTPPTLAGLWSTFCNKEHNASAHFGVEKNGEMWQFVDTDDRAWSVDGDTIDAHWISIENIGIPGDALTEEQIMACANLVFWLNQTYGCPIKEALDKNDSGVSYHALFQRAHPGCPGKPVISLIPRICASAIAGY
jgi:hypothetical protein